jgi:hypothetical protein
VGVAVRFFQAGLVYVLMSVLRPIVVGVAVLMGDVVVLMRGVHVRVGLVAMVVFVRVRVVVRVLGHDHLLPV